MYRILFVLFAIASICCGQSPGPPVLVYGWEGKQGPDSSLQTGGAVCFAASPNPAVPLLYPTNTGPLPMPCSVGNTFNQSEGVQLSDGSRIVLTGTTSGQGSPSVVSAAASAGMGFDLIESTTSLYQDNIPAPVLPGQTITIPFTSVVSADSAVFVTAASDSGPSRALVRAFGSSGMSGSFALPPLTIGPSGTYSISLVVQAVAFTLPVNGPVSSKVTASLTPVILLDPVSDLVTGGLVTSDSNRLATGGTPAFAIAADGVAQLVIRIQADQPGDQYQVTVLNDQQQAGGSTDDDGSVGLPGTSANGFTASSMSVTATGTSNSGPMAFAVYRAPVDFARTGSSLDPVQPSRQGFLQIQKSGQNPVLVPFRILRPPLSKIHGLWDGPTTWDTFTGLANDARFPFQRTPHYDQQVPIATSAGNQVPTYPPSILSKVKANSLGFTYNAQSVLGQIRNDIKEFRSANHAAAVQTDVVVHSMGGDVTRAMPLLSSYAESDNYQQGSIHKLITIGTPHLGTPLLRDLLQDSNSCVRNAFAFGGSIALSTTTLADGTVVPGAAGDLSGDGQGGGLSSALQLLQVAVPHPIPTAMIAGAMNSGNLAGAGLSPMAIALIFACAPNPLAQALAPQNWNALFGGQFNDQSVSVTSSLNNNAPATGVNLFFGYIHAQATEALGFGGPFLLDGTVMPPVIGPRVVDLLNTPITNRTNFTLLP
jgi:hypothetical protein